MFMLASAFERFALPRVDSREGRARPGASRACVALRWAWLLSRPQAAFLGFLTLDFLAFPVRSARARNVSALVAMAFS
jgi:hypothetical protein